MKQHVRGFTLIELMVSIGILAILTTVAIPSFTSIMINYRLTTIANTFVASAQLARSEAIKRNSRVTMCKSANGTTCTTTGGWEQGWILYQDVNNNGAINSPEDVIILTESKVADKFSMTFVDNYISFTASGGSELINGAFQAGTMTLCSQSDPVGPAKWIVLNGVGRLRVQKFTATTCT